MLCVHIIAIVLYLLDRFSPLGRSQYAKRQDMKKCKINQSTYKYQLDDSFNLSQALWFTWGILLNSGVDEG